MKSIATNAPTQQTETVVGSSEPEVVRLASLLRAYTPHDGRFIPGVQCHPRVTS